MNSNRLMRWIKTPAGTCIIYEFFTIEPVRRGTIHDIQASDRLKRANNRQQHRT